MDHAPRLHRSHCTQALPGPRDWAAASSLDATQTQSCQTQSVRLTSTPACQATLVVTLAGVTQLLMCRTRRRQAGAVKYICTHMARSHHHIRTHMGSQGHTAGTPQDKWERMDTQQSVDPRDQGTSPRRDGVHGTSLTWATGCQQKSRCGTADLPQPTGLCLCGSGALSSVQDAGNLMCTALTPSCRDTQYLTTLKITTETQCTQ